MVELKTALVKNRYLLTVIAVTEVVILLVLISVNIYFRDKIFPRVKIAGIAVSRLTKNEAQALLAKNILTPKPIRVTLKDKEFDINPDEVDYSYDVEGAIDNAYLLYRSGDPIDNIIKRVLSPIIPVNIPLPVNINKDKLIAFIQNKSSGILVEPIYPQVGLIKGQIEINTGASGEKIDLEKLEKDIDVRLVEGNFSIIHIPVLAVDPRISSEEMDTLRARGEKLVGKKINLNFEYDSYVLKDSEIIPLLSGNGSYDYKTLQKIVDDEVAPIFDREPQNAVFKVESGKAVEFLPAKDGVKVKSDELENQIIQSLESLESSDDKQITLDLPVTTTAAKITTGEVNSLGITNLIGRGTSKFAGSIPSRIHNVTLAAAKFNGVLIAPGETFSFNKTLGDVSVYTGYKQAYIIKDGKTILGDGGGVCQVSTTLFRALLNAGLPIIERHAHSYRVGYYEQDSPPGLDATVYDPSPDLKFSNDTPSYLLIQTKVDPSIPSLVFEIYGKSDGRIATITKPIISDVIAPSDDLYQDDPTLKQGVIKQIEHKAWGAKITFKYNVTRDNETVYEKTFVSTYRPWQAVYLRGTAN